MRNHPDWEDYRACRCGAPPSDFTVAMVDRTVSAGADIAKALCRVCGTTAVAVTWPYCTSSLMEAWNEINTPEGRDAGIERAFK